MIKMKLKYDFANSVQFHNVIIARRTLQRMEKTEIVCPTGIGQCEVSEMSKACSACRYDKCLAVGMKGDLLQV